MDTRENDFARSAAESTAGPATHTRLGTGRRPPAMPRFRGDTQLAGDRRDRFVRELLRRILRPTGVHANGSTPGLEIVLFLLFLLSPLLCCSVEPVSPFSSVSNRDLRKSNVRAGSVASAMTRQPEARKSYNPATPLNFAAGTRLGPYEILSAVSAGGMGTVYKAQDTRLERTVAIKVLKSSKPSGDQSRLLREAKTHARLSHPNVVTVYDIGETDGTAYIVTEFIEGRSLASILRERERLNEDEAVGIVATVGEALAFMHHNGLIHRDIKPANILVADSGRVLLSDFGVASDFDQVTVGAGAMVLGTPQYMSPEQAMGLPLDGRSDIYSLAVVLYEALAGGFWFQGSEVGEILRVVVEHRPPGIQQRNPRVSNAVSAILEKALSRDRSARFATADDFVRALRATRLPVGAARPKRSDSASPRADNEALQVHDLPATAAVAPYPSDAGRRLKELSTLWTELSRAATTDRDRFVAATTAMIAGPLREAIGYRIEQAVPYLKGTVGFVVEAPALWIRHSRFPIIFVAYDHSNRDVLATVVQQLEIAKATEFFALLVVVPAEGTATGEEAREFNDLVAESVYRHDFVVLDSGLLQRLIAGNSSRGLIEIILEQRTELLSALSPYVVSGPVPESMFFGRESQLKMISQNINRSNFAVVGGRRIGKSSILLRLRHLFGNDPRYRAIYIDCEARCDEDNFLSAVSESLNLTHDGGMPSFPRLLAALRRQDQGPQTVVFLLDEIDELLNFDAERRSGGSLFKSFRAASQEGLCRFVFSGSRTLHRHLRDPHSPFFNFCEAIALGRLEEKSIVEIVCQPMQQLGFDIPERERLVTRLIELTSSHPNLAQWMCDRLIKTSVGKSITVEVLEQIATTPEFQEHYVNTAWGDASAREKLITLLMEGPAFSDADVISTLEQAGVPADDRAVRESLDILRLYALLDRDEAGYRFAMSQFPRIVRESGVAPLQVKWLSDEVSRRCL
jgi:serine/threonine protein kinase